MKYDLGVYSDKDACKKCKLSWFSDQVDAWKWSLVSINKIPKLSFARPEQSRTNQVVDQKITLTHTCLSCHSLKQRCSSVSLNVLALLPLHKYLTHPWGFFSYLLVLSYWELEWLIKQYLLAHRSAIHLEIFLKIFENVAKFPKMILSKHPTFIVFTRAVIAFGLPYYG